MSVPNKRTDHLSLSEVRVTSCSFHVVRKTLKHGDYCVSKQGRLWRKYNRSLLCFAARRPVLTNNNRQAWLSRVTEHHRHNFVCDGSDMSTPHLKVVVTITTTSSRAIWIFLHSLFLWKIYVQILTLFCQNLLASGGLRPWPPTRGSVPDPRYRLGLHALAICPRPLSPPLFGVKLRPCWTVSDNLLMLSHDWAWAGRQTRLNDGLQPRVQDITPATRVCLSWECSIECDRISFLYRSGCSATVYTVGTHSASGASRT